MEDQRLALQAWAVQNLPRAMTRGYKLALGSQDPKEIRQWVDMLTRIGGAAAEKALDTSGGLAVFQFNFVEGQVAAQEVHTIEAQTREVPQPQDTPAAPEPGSGFMQSEPPQAAVQEYARKALPSLDELLSP